MKKILVASSTVLSRKTYLFTFLAFTPLAFFIFVFIPTVTIPGNSIDFQLSIFTTRDYVLLGILSLLTSLFLVIQIFIFRNSLNSKARLSTIGKGGIGGYAAVVASVFGTASCSACLFALFGFLGASTLLFLIQHQWYIVSGAIILILISLYFTARKVNGICDLCRINKSAKD